MASCREAYLRLAECIYDVVDPFSSVLDVGCGLWYVIERLGELHPCGTEGWDLYSPVADRKVDLRKPVEGHGSWDLVICTETAEHLEEKYADQIVETLCACAKKEIVWSAAQPGQEGVDHLNLKPSAWWLEKFEALGWKPDATKTRDLRHAMQDNRAQHMHCCDNFFVLEPA